MIHKLNAPGSVYGPCEDGCVHQSCQLENLAAKQKCHFCSKEIGYETAYTFIDAVPVHVLCLEPPDNRFADLPEDEPPTTSTLH